jgi:bifunctional DNase/RNase
MQINLYISPLKPFEMQKTELHLVAIANSDQHPHNFIVILREKMGNRRLPIVIGAFEAHAIAVALENIQPARPMTHDLLKNTMEAVGARLQEVIVASLSDSIFYAVMHWEMADGRIYAVDARSSDALALALRANCPIFASSAVMDEAGIEMESEAEKQWSASTADLPENELQRRLEQAIEQENYEEAARIRDEIKTRRAQQ